jgi:hypothetical protein
MNPVAPPTTVGSLHWPVLSAVRVSTANQPAEFVVLVDCGEPTPREPYATLRNRSGPTTARPSRASTT